MSLFVVGASVGVKWFVPEADAAFAQRLQDPAHELHIPAFFDVEVANILWKKIQRGELTRAEADAVLVQLPGLPITRHAEAPRLPQALALAVDQCSCDDASTRCRGDHCPYRCGGT